MRSWQHGASPAWFAVLVGPLMMWALVVALSAAALAWTGQLQRSDAARGFGERAEVAAGFTHTYLASVAQQQQQDAARLLTGRTVSQRELDLFGSGFGYATFAVFDDQGRTMVTSPPNPSLIGVNVAAKQEHIRVALQQGRIAISGTFMSLALRKPMVAIAMPFSTPYGRRAFAGGFVVEGSRLDAYLRQAAVPTGGRAYYVDRSGNIVAATGPVPSQVAPLTAVNPALARALARRPQGTHVENGRSWHYAAAPVRVTGWRLVTETPESRLYAEAGRTQRRFGAVLLLVAALGLGGAVILGVSTRRRRIIDRRLRRLNRRYADQADELKAVNHELEVFSYGVVRDLRTPLRRLGEDARSALDDHAGRMPVEATRLVEEIKAEADRANDTVDALLSYSRAQREQMHPETVDLTALTRQVWDNLAEQRTGRDVRLDLADLPLCEGDPDLLRQVLGILLENAIQFTRDRATARIEVGSTPGPGDRTTYHVKDNGVGFDPDQVDRLFKPFQRLHGDDGYPGAGIGLAIADRIVNRHGGRMAARSTPDEEATFTFTLPASTVPERLTRL